MTDFFLIYN